MDADERDTAWALDRWTGGNQTIWYDTWIVVHENVTHSREMVWHPRRLGIIIFGAVLASWIVALNIVLALTLLKKRKFQKIRPVNWLILNFLLAEFLTGTFVVPLSVKTERDGGWRLGGALCRTWLLMQIFLASLSAWSAMVITVDRLVYALKPEVYARRMTACRVGVLLAVVWAVSAATIIPPALSMYHDPDFVFEEVCAMSMTRSYALGISISAFFTPAVLLVLGTLGIAILAIQRRSPRPQQPSHDAQALCDNANKKRCPDDNALALVDSYRLCNVATSIFAVNFSVVALWCPFYVLNVMIPYCEGMCVDPNLWSLCVWLGYASAGVSPVLWFIDLHVRRQYKDLVMCRRDVVYYDEENDSTSGEHKKWHFDENINIFKPYLYLKQEPTS